MLLTAFYDYGQVDEVLGLAIRALEMALRQRLGISKGSTKHGNKFFQLINEAEEKGLLTRSAESLHSMRRIRNEIVHGTDMRLGIVAFDPIQHVVDAINELYQDTDIRLRSREEERINAHLKRLSKTGGNMILPDYNVGVFVGECIYLDNRKGPSKYVLTLWPYFDLTIVNGRVDDGTPIQVESTDLIVDDSGLLFGTPSAMRLVFYTGDEAASHKDWMRRFNGHEMPLPFLITHRLAQIRTVELRRARFAEGVEPTSQNSSD